MNISSSASLSSLSLSLSAFLFLCLCPPPIDAVEALCFRVVRPSVLPCVRASVRPCVLLAQRLTNQWTEFHQTLVDDVVEATDELTGF